MVSYEYSYALEEGLAVLSGLFSGIPSTALGIASYVLTALALYTVAKRRDIQKPWLAWIPVVNVWLVGSISDQYRYVVKGENKSKRKILLILNILMTALGCALVTCVVVAVVQALWGTDPMDMIMGIAGLALPMGGIAIAHAIVYFMALYDVYTSMDPVNNVLFLVLSILFGVTEPFFLFFNRNKDLGMPPRRDDHIYTPPYYPLEDEIKDFL